MKIQKLTLLMAAIVTLSACADGRYNPVAFDDKFGAAHRSTINAQIANPQAAQNPSPDSPKIMDGYAGVSTMQGYREGFGQIDTSQPVIVNIGGGSSGGGGGQ
jgi:hypothetical protein